MRVGIRRVFDGQRESAAIGAVVPAVFVAKVQNGPAYSIFERDSLAGVVKPAGVLACDVNISAVASFKNASILNDYCILAWRKVNAREGKIYAVRETYQIQVNGFGTDVL